MLRNFFYIRLMQLKLDLLVTEIKLAMLKAGFRDDQERDEHGRWTDEGSGGSDHTFGDSVVEGSSHFRVMPVSDEKPTPNIDFALRIFHNNSGLGTDGDCAQQVRGALNRAGFNVGKPKNSIYAKDYGETLKEAGFKAFISDTKPSTPPNEKLLKLGDVAIIKPAKGGNPAGHMQIYDGVRWYPRFPRDEFWPGAPYRSDNPDYTIYRYYGKM
jgi:hypothetical protein